MTDKTAGPTENPSIPPGRVSVYDWLLGEIGGVRDALPQGGVRYTFADGSSAEVGPESLAPRAFL